MSETLVNISFYSDHLKLSGTLHLPEVPHPPVVVGSHGLASDGDSPKQIDLAKACTRLGMAYFRFHHRGCGKSEGYFPEVTTLENRKTDLLAAVKTVMARKDTGDNLALFGSSMGGTTCIAASETLKVNGYVLVAPPVYGKTLIQAPENLQNEPELGREFYERLLDFDMSSIIPTINNILIFHGDNDATVPLFNGETCFRLAGEPKKLIIQKGGDHRISSIDHQKEFIRQASLWFKNCFGL